MNNYSCQLLEFDQFLNLISEYTECDATKSEILNLQPSAYATESIDLKLQVADALKWLRKHRKLLKVNFSSPTDGLRRALPIGAVLPAEDFQIIRQLIDNMVRTKEFLEQEDLQAYLSLRKIAEHLPDLSMISDQWQSVFELDGSVKNSASRDLGRIRAEIREIETRLRSRLESLLKHYDDQELLQEDHITLRNNRYVMPVRREHRSKFKGVIHDQSITGHTLFMEPSQNLEDGNELASLKLQERDEIRRILASMTDLVRDHSEEIELGFNLLCIYDMICAIAHWGFEYDCHYPEFGKVLKLKKARHPLLERQFRLENRRDDLVPLDLSLDNKIKLLAITGSNTGGKTVMLKTIGLLHLIAQCGLPVPCEPDSKLIRFKNILGDIGDQQSISESLSTFSAHLSQLKSIIEKSEEGDTLILLDELGTGTGPTEGAALSCAIMNKLIKSNRSLTILTTHLANIKHYVHETEFMENASVLFNEKSLKPEYLVKIGMPGSSHALAIAKNMGIPEAVIEDAYSFLNEDQLNMETLISKLEADQYKLTRSLEVAQAARDKALKDQKELAEELKTLRKERKKLLNKAQKEAASLVSNTRKEMEQLLKKSGQDIDKEAVKEVRQEIKQKQEKLNKGISQTESKPEAPLKVDEIEVGQLVWLENLQEHGRVSRVGDRNRVQVELNGLSFDINVKHIGRARKKDVKKEAVVRLHKPITKSSVSSEIKLIGMRVEAALDELELYLDSAAMGNLAELKIVHGLGTGALREAVHEYLKSCHLVSTFRLGIVEKDPGGPGVTWVTLK